MALITCPECEKQISDTAASCPQCGYTLVSVDTVEANIKKSELGELQKDSTLGVILIVLGIVGFMLTVPLFLLFVIPGIISGTISVILIMKGSNNFSGAYSTKCPYCDTPIKVQRDAKNRKCNSCEKTSIVKDGYLETVR